MTTATRTMRDVFIEAIIDRMEHNGDIFFLTADFGAPALDILKDRFSERFINTGIAEQNLVNVAAGLALEGATVYAYAIAPFLTMRACEQIRTDLSLQAQHRVLNVNLVGVGAGMSYDVSGPTHHCLEDLSIMRTLPNIEIFSPSDYVLVEKFVDYSIAVKRPKYLRLDGKPVAALYDSRPDIGIDAQFCELTTGSRLCFAATGRMTHTALEAARILATRGIRAGVVDMFLLRPLDETRLAALLGTCDCIVSLEEGFRGKGGLDSLMLGILARHQSAARFMALGFDDTYDFTVGTREFLHRRNNLDPESVAGAAEKFLRSARPAGGNLTDQGR